jgi:hypothetical protein
MSNEIIIPSKTINNEPTWGEYTIKQCNAKIYDKYTTSRASFFYDSYINKSSDDPDLQYKITNIDCIMTNYMNSRIGLVAIDNIFSKIGTIELKLKEVNNLHVADMIDLREDHFIVIRDLFKELMVDGIKISIASKILHMKFPNTIPILDSYVMNALFRKNNAPQLNDWVTEADKAIVALKVFQYIYNQNRENLDEISLMVRKDFKSHPYLANLNISNIRILETLIWFDWGGWENFDTWKYFNGIIVKK